MPGSACSAGWRATSTRRSRALLLAETLGVLRLPDLAALFGPGSRPEQPVCGWSAGRWWRARSTGWR
jgi:hypothetical protein